MFFGSDLNQEDLIAHLKAHLSSLLDTIFTESHKRALLRAFEAKINFEKLLLSSAMRKAYGMVPKNADLYTDKTPEAVWTWELTTANLYLEPLAILKETLSTRETLSCLGGLITSLRKLQSLIEKAKKEADLPGMSSAHAKYIKLQQRRDEQKKKLLAKELKEKQLRQKAEEKKRLAEQERQQKENERIAREQERIKAKQDREIALLQEKQDKERLRELEKAQREQAKEQERLAKEQAREAERLEREAAKERERVEKEQKRLQIENDKLEKKRKLEEAAK